jgi:hypothetical protein
LISRNRLLSIEPLHHSDRGSQYTSEQFQKLMAGPPATASPEARLRLRFGGALSHVPNRLAFPDFHSRLAQLLGLLGTDVEPFQFQSKVTQLGTPAGPLFS